MNAFVREFFISLACLLIGFAVVIGMLHSDSFWVGYVGVPIALVCFYRAGYPIWDRCPGWLPRVLKGIMFWLFELVLVGTAMFIVMAGLSKQWWVIGLAGLVSLTLLLVGLGLFDRQRFPWAWRVAAGIICAACPVVCVNIIYTCLYHADSLPVEFDLDRQQALLLAAGCPFIGYIMLIYCWRGGYTPPTDPLFEPVLINAPPQPKNWTDEQALRTLADPSRSVSERITAAQEIGRRRRDPDGREQLWSVLSDAREDFGLRRAAATAWLPFSEADSGGRESALAKLPQDLRKLSG